MDSDRPSVDDGAARDLLPNRCGTFDCLVMEDRALADIGYHWSRGEWWVFIGRASDDLPMKNQPNQAPEPTPTTVTPPAGQEARQP